MRVIAVACALLASCLGGCVMPRPWLAPHLSDACPTSAEPITAGVLVATFRASYCRHGNPRWTVYRSAKPQFSAVASDGATQVVTEDAWLSELRSRARGTAPIIYIHGYFNNQAEAVRRAYAIRTLLCDEDESERAPLTCTPGRPVVALTWPSYNRLAKYTWDEANSEWAEAHATKLILKIAEEYKGTVLIAHSMGNRVLVAAALASAREGVPSMQLVLASPDVDRQYLAELLAQDSGGLGYHATIYASRKDQALSASWRTHGNPRAGDLSYWASGHAPAYPYRTIHNADVVDTTALHAGATGHAAFIETPEAAADLCHVLAGKPNPHREADSLYWALPVDHLAGDICEKRASSAVKIAKSNAKQFEPR